MDFDPLQLFMAILRYVPAIVVVVVAVAFVFSFKIVVVSDELERTNIQVAEALMASSELTYDRAVFDKDKIDKMIRDANVKFYGEARINKDGNVEEEPNIEDETIARHCRIAYRAEIEELKRENLKQPWKRTFGYAPAAKDVPEPLEATASYDVALRESVQGAESTSPARLTVTVRDTWLSRLGCMIEEAYEFREPRTTAVPCLYESRTGATDASGVAKPGKVQCLVEIRKSDANGKHICLHKPSYIYSGFNEVAECRYFPKSINLVDSSWLYNKEGSTKKLTVYPLEETLGQLTEKELREKCESLDITYKAIPLPEVKDAKSVILCLA